MPERPQDDRKARRRRHEARGRRAETWAAWMLWLKGYRILDQRARTPAGEIDLVAARGRILAFVEVKARTRRETALEAVTPALRHRLERAAALWAQKRRGMAALNWRFDIVMVTPGRWPEHLPDAWRAEM